MPRSTDKQAKRLAELRKEVTKRGYDPHAVLLKTVSELPPGLQSPSITPLAAREPIEAIVVFPPQIQHGWSYVPKQALLFTPTNVIHILASIWPDQAPQVTCLRACDLLYIKVTLQLLYGFLEFVAPDSGSPVHLGLEFNTVAWDCLSRPLRKFLLATQAVSGPLADKPSYSLSAQFALKELPLKFSNGVRIYGLLPGEELQELVFQPRTWKRWLHFFRQPLSPNILLMLTSNYIVVIAEELEVEQGWLLSYIPRSHIVGMQDQACGPWNELSIQLKQGSQCVDYGLKLLKPETAEAWHQQWIQHGGQWLDQAISRN